MISHQNIILYNEEGKVLFEYKNVGLEHISENIYYIYDINNKEIMRFHKGQNMLLVTVNSENDY